MSNLSDLFPEHPEPSMDDGWTDEEIWGEKQVSCGTVEGHGVEDTNEAGDAGAAYESTSAPLTRSGYQAPPAGIHTGTTLDALGDSVSRAFQRAKGDSNGRLHS